MSKDHIFPEDSLTQTEDVEIPALDIQTANQMLNNVFTACDMNPNTIPVEVLESWGNYRRNNFHIGRVIAYVCTVLLVLLPLLFIRPSIIAKRTDVSSTSNAIYHVEVRTLLPVREAYAELDGRPVSLVKTDSHSYTAELTQNGSLTLTATSINGQTVSRTYQVSHLDTDKPELISSHSEDGLVYLELLDTYSGIDYENISGLTPESIDTDTGVVTFHIPETPTTVIIPDNAGNELSLLLSPVQ